MIERCTNPRASDFPSYGGRGIAVCDRWRHDFSAFLADLGERPAGMSLDRIDVNGNYETGNVRWATTEGQARNTRKSVVITHAGRTQNLIEWARETGINRGTIRLRLRAGWSVEKALTTPAASRAERGIMGLRARGVIA